MKIAIVGTGNVATHLAIALAERGCEITQIYDRKMENAAALAARTLAQPIDQIRDLDQNSDFCIFAVSDNALAPLIAEGAPHLGKKTLPLHTAGSISIDVFKGLTENCGVMYPLQTFSKQRAVNFNEIPLFIEGNSFAAEQRTRDLARVLSFKIYPLSSEQRRQVHLAGVFACNFTNALYGIAGEVLAQGNVPFDVLRPLIMETARKVQTLTPAAAQTGPAVRGDSNVIAAHLTLLENTPEKAEIYRLLSNEIGKKATK